MANSDRIWSAVFTFASLPVWPQQKSLWTETEHASDVCEARVGTSSVVEGTVPGILAIQAIVRESSAWQILTGACEAPERIVARVLTWSVAIAQETLVDVFVVRLGRKEPIE